MNIKSVLLASILSFSLIGVQTKAQALDKQQIISRIGLIAGSCSIFWCLNNRPAKFNPTTELYKKNKEFCDKIDRSVRNLFLAKLFSALMLTGISLKYLK